MPLCDALDGYLDQFYAPSDDTPTEDEFDLFVNILRDNDALRQMPQMLFKQVLPLVDENALPLDVCRAVQKEAQRRVMR